MVCQTGGDSRVRQDQVKALDIETALAVPLIHEGRLLGALMVLNRMNGTPYDQDAEQALIELAESAAVQIAQIW
ncbi:GAF domain-containing protein [Leptothermofonsia sp. ETS-13]|uniref:GAF domain-containing protein n=1 Tax=Leptothermofonsia sp. ETS-13 TaxID=3035696 RepID=UPI003BA34195